MTLPHLPSVLDLFGGVAQVGALWALPCALAREATGRVSVTQEPLPAGVAPVDSAAPILLSYSQAYQDRCDHGRWSHTGCQLVDDI
jgi:hypothetical protein